MDPLSIAASCVGITAGIATLTDRITTIVSTVREARKDLDGIRRELGSIQLSLSILSSDDEKFNFNRTPDLKTNLKCVLDNCNGTIGEINEVLEEVVGKKDELKVRGKTRWLMTGKGKVEKLRGGLEAHKSALEIALDLITLSHIVDIKADTSKLKDDTTKIKGDTHVILEEIGKLQAQVATLDISHDREFVIRKFLESSTEYAETVENGEMRRADTAVAVTEDYTQEELDGEIDADIEDFIAKGKPYPNLERLRLSSQHFRNCTLVYAAEHDNIHIVKQALQCGADIDAYGSLIRTALAWAIVNDNEEILRVLLDNGAGLQDVAVSLKPDFGDGDDEWYCAEDFVEECGHDKARRMILDRYH